MDDAFNLDELQEFAFDYGIDFENIEGDTKREKITSRPSLKKSPYKMQHGLQPHQKLNP